jgi:hypothetical protein
MFPSNWWEIDPLGERRTLTVKSITAQAMEMTHFGSLAVRTGSARPVSILSPTLQQIKHTFTTRGGIFLESY